MSISLLVPKRSHFLSTALALCAFFGSRAAAAPKDYDFSAVTDRIQGWVDKGYYPGAAIRVVKDGRIVYEKGFGGYTSSTPVALISATKWLEAATVMAVVDEGKIDLDAPISRYLPQFSGEKGLITVRQCLSHTSGINSIKLSTPDDHTDSIAERANQLAAGDLKEKPGARFTYGGNGLALAGRVAEVATGKPWEILFAEKIAKPCQMKATTTGMNLWYVQCHGGAPCAISTVEDYSHFLEMLVNEGIFRGTQVLSSHAIQEMQSDQVRGADISANPFILKVRGSRHNGVYGFGEWREDVDEKGNALVLSSPGWYGFYPWIDKRNHAFGVFAGDADNEAARVGKFPAFFESPKLSQLVDAILR